MQVFLDYDNYSDFRKKDWSQFFKLLAGKLDAINQNLCRVEADRDATKVEYDKIKARFDDFNFDT